MRLLLEILYIYIKITFTFKSRGEVGEGVFVSFQYPTSLPGVNNVYFFKRSS